MPVEGRNLTFGTLLEETKSPEIGVAYQLQQDSAVSEGTLPTSEDGDILGVTSERKTERRVLAGEASRRARCGKLARRVR